MTRLLQSNLFIFCILALVIFIVFGNALFNGFSYDDHYLIIENPFIKDFSFAGKVFFSDVTVATPLAKASGYYRPLSMVYLMGIYQIFGMNTVGLHLMNLILHILSTFFVFLLLKYITKDFVLALATGLVFAVHPIHVEAVAPIFNYMGLLASCFSLGAFFLFVKSEGFANRRLGIWSVVLFAFALFSKEEAIVLPAIFVLYDFYFVSKFSFEAFKKRMVWYLLYGIPIGIYLALRFLIIEKQAAFGFWGMPLNLNIPVTDGLIFKALSIVQTFTKYITLLIFPRGLSAFYLFEPVSAMSVVEIFASIGLMLMIAVYGILSIKRNPLISFFIAFFFISSYLISNIIPIGGLFAERFMYFPSLSYCVLGGWIFSKVWNRFSSPSLESKRYLCVIILGITLALYAQTASARNYIWRNDITLWRDTVQKVPHSAIVHLFLADAYYGKEFYEESVKEYKIVLKYSGMPYVRVYNTIGKIYGMDERYDEAIAEFQKALAQNDQEVETYYNLGITYVFKGDLDAAHHYFEKGKIVDKSYAWIYYGLGMIAEKKGQMKAASDYYREAHSLNSEIQMAEKAIQRIYNKENAK